MVGNVDANHPGAKTFEAQASQDTFPVDRFHNTISPSTVDIPYIHLCRLGHAHHVKHVIGK